MIYYDEVDYFGYFDGYHYLDHYVYFGYGTGTTSVATSTLAVNDYFVYVPDVGYIDYFHYYVYFFHIPKISFPASNPNIPSFHTCAP